ncbi:MAG: calcium-binding protein, partial [Oscillatoriales cyanobacterium]
GEGSDVIADFTKGEDLLVLAGGLTFAQLTITQSPNAGAIAISQNGQLLATVNTVAGSAIDRSDFILFGR